MGLLNGLLNRMRNLAFGEYIGDLLEETSKLYIEVRKLREALAAREAHAVRVETSLRNQIAELSKPTVGSVQLELLQRALAQAQGENRSLKALLKGAENEDTREVNKLRMHPNNWGGAGVRSVRVEGTSSTNGAESRLTDSVFRVGSDTDQPGVRSTCGDSYTDSSSTTRGGDYSSCTSSSSSSSE